MRGGGIHFFPIARPFLFALFVLLTVTAGLVEIGVVQYSCERMGVDRRYVFLVLFLSLVGSYVNIPFAELPAERMLSNHEVTYFGMRYVVPRISERGQTLLAVNLGGAVIPVLLAFYLVVKNGLYGRALLATLIVAAVSHWVAQPIRGVGIAMPIFLPPLLAASISLVLTRSGTPALAYVAGSLGTLIGADLLNLGAIRDLGAPVASIGGAGTFDGIFLTGIIAVLLA
jgi:uncharacterized membrane protein